MAAQRHIHLDDPGVAHDTDGAPAARWVATERGDVVTAQVSVSRSHTGHTYVARVVDASGNPVVHRDWRFALRVSLAEYDYLRTLIALELEFIDHLHPADGENASAYIRPVVLRSVTGVKNLSPMLLKYDATIELVSMEQPS